MMIMKERLKTTRVNVTLPIVLKLDMQEKASISGLSLSRYVGLLLKNKSKHVTIISDGFLSEIREINETIKHYQQQGEIPAEFNEKLNRFISIYADILNTLRSH